MLQDIHTPEELLEKMSDIEYGYIDHRGNKHLEVDKQFDEQYFLQTPEEVSKNQIGVCWDQVEYERYFFKNFGLPFETFFIVYYTDAECPSHTFLVFERAGKCYWFEHSWGVHRGIHAYTSKTNLLNDVRQKFLESHQIQENFDPDYLCLNSYPQPQPHLSCAEFYHYQETCRKLEQENR